MLGNLASSIYSENNILPSIHSSLASSSSYLSNGDFVTIPAALSIFKTLLACSSVALVSYMAIVRRRRYRGINRLLKKYPDPTLPLRDLKVAQEINSFVTTYEFPFMTAFSVQMGVLKTNGIQSISKIVVSTKQIANYGKKRIEDTNLLLAEALETHTRREARSLMVDEVNSVTGEITTKLRGASQASVVDDEELKEQANDEVRSKIAIDRINFLHSHYKISQDDYLYNLAMFALESTKWIGEYDFRPLTELERNAMLAVWTDLGHKMGIENIPETVQEFEQWIEEYELRAMKYAPINETMIEQSIAISQSLFESPEAKARVKKFFNALLYPRLREAVGYEEPTKAQVFWSQSILWIRGCIVKYFMMPRTVPKLLTAMRSTKFEDTNVQDIKANSKREEPVELTGGCPFSGGKRYVPRFHELGPIYPRGYKIEELGPAKFFGKGPHVCPVAGLSINPAS
ncbi:hypothetical protein BGZ76_004634 [Entomortierella beljakovae]|nr:hypothetical protein BGZ76_004634 [Entomortierella beljakovae]